MTAGQSVDANVDKYDNADEKNDDEVAAA